MNSWTRSGWFSLICYQCNFSSDCYYYFLIIENQLYTIFSTLLNILFQYFINVVCSSRVTSERVLLLQLLPFPCLFFSRKLFSPSSRLHLQTENAASHQFFQKIRNLIPEFCYHHEVNHQIKFSFTSGIFYNDSLRELDSQKVIVLLNFTLVNFKFI